MRNSVLQYFFALCLAAIAASCSSKVTTNNTTSAGKYSEDLSVLRPKIDLPGDTAKKTTNNSIASVNNVYLEPRHTVNAQLDAVLDSIDRINLAHGTVDGFTIQLYSGKQQDEALNVKKQIAQAMPQLDADVQFSQPNFRVRAGKYISRGEAQKDFMAVKRLFPNAILIPERISIR